MQVSDEPLTDDERRQLAQLEKALADDRREEKVIDVLLCIVFALGGLTLALAVLR